MFFILCPYVDYDGKISWKEFVYTAYPDETLRNTEDLDYDKKKFDMADANHDRVLDSKEFSSFYFPGVYLIFYFSHYVYTYAYMQ